MLSYFGETRKECAGIFRGDERETKKAASIMPAATLVTRVVGFDAFANLEAGL
jgi:hypothetical protein